MTFRKDQKRNSGRGGFTLMEMLIVIAVGLVLLALAVAGLTRLRRNLHQKELDSKAEIIYVAAQYRISELRASGYENVYQYTDGANGVNHLGYIPDDADEQSEIDEDTLCYVVDTGKTVAGQAAAEILPEAAVDGDLWNSQWHIEYDPVSGSVYSVFYSETDAIPATQQEQNQLRYRKARLNGGAVVGYYGGDLAQTEVTNTLQPRIFIENAEKLIATFYCNNPNTDTASTDRLTFEITLTDAAGHSYTRTVASDKLTQVNSRTYRYIWVLDSLESEQTRFYAQSGGALDCGTALTVKLTAKSSNPLIDQQSTEAVTSSLFADPRTGSTADTALIGYGRHLQNLDAETSHVTASITKAIQISDISFQDDTANDKDWYSYYGEYFLPITNSRLVSYDGHDTVSGNELDTAIYGLHIADQGTQAAGLFRSFAGSIANVTLTGVRVDGGGNTGALIGETSGALTLDNCRSFLSSRRGDLTGIPVQEKAADVAPWIRGITVGGLIGRADAPAVIRTSLASSVLDASERAGGLVGLAGSSLAVYTSYADCYLKAPVTGGLIGGESDGASIALENFYAAGYQTAAQTAAGLVPGPLAVAKNGYAAFDYTTSAGLSIYSTAASCANTEHVFYLSGFAGSAQHLPQAPGLSYRDLSDAQTAQTLGEAFTLSSGDATFPYNLLGQGLTYYSYPRLTALNHYGDWQAEFESGALVYYERYADGSYGFSGANVDTLASNTFAVGDGYALAYDEAPDAATEIILTYNGGMTKKIKVGTATEVRSGSKRYYLVALPIDVVNTTYFDTSAPDAFYQQILIDDVSYYYNPHFAKTVTVNDKKPEAPETIYVRTARHLYNLSRYYEQYADAVANSLFQQELDIDYTPYLWTEYANCASVSVQEPIYGRTGFSADYDGGYHTITGISFRSSSTQIGLFGTILNGSTVRNVFLTGRVGEESVSYVNTGGGSAASGSRNSASLGALAGVNYGSIRNCAVSGYQMTYYGYRANIAAIGGLAGTNYGVIRDCSADAAGIDLANTNASAYVGGFVGRNHSAITACYAVGRISVLDARNSTVWIAGFAADNSSGVIRRSYAATALTASGTAESYGFAHTGGAVAECRYLDGGTYSYAGELYAYNTSTNEYAQAGSAAGRSITGDELIDLTLSGFAPADASYAHDLTGLPTDNYIYPAVVEDADRLTVHYGNWPVQQDIGTLGVFYWELESGGSNSGYHFSYIGTNQGKEISSAENDLLRGNSLCEEHNDGGSVTAYGYGYFYQSGAAKPELDVTDCVLGGEDEEAGAELGLQMPGYTFVAYRTGETAGRMYLTSAAANSTWTLRYGSGTSATVYNYLVCPFFADSISLDSTQLAEQDVVYTDAPQPGSAENVYQIRSIAQLQFINWNYGELSTGHSISSNVTQDSSRSKYPYLAYSEPPHEDLDSKDKNLFFQQSHDMDSYLEKGGDYAADPSTLFTPIGSLYDDTNAMTSAYSNPYAAYFDSSFDGQAYAIKNIEIRSTTQCLGLFGVTIGAKLKNIIMYSDRGNSVWNLPDGENWYCVGGLVGLAGKRGKADSAFENCTVSGYKILDQRSKGYEDKNSYETNPHGPGWGGGCVGGLVGATNMDITRCTSVADVTLDIGYWISFNNLRVGGLAGVCRGTVTYCYAGGSIDSPVKSKTHNLNFSACTSIWVGGIVGGIIMRDQGSLMNLLGSVTEEVHVKNSYSFVQMPSWDETTWVMGTHAIASNGEMQWIFELVKNPNIYIENCYTLASTAQNAEDYKRWIKYKNSHGNQDPDWSKWNLNAWADGTDAKRAIYILNDSNPFLSYDDMLSGSASGFDLAAQMNKYAAADGVSGFGRVTVTEHGANIDGKYSFPGDDAALLGLNYPFPTILTQTDVFGNTVNVHYGAWPKFDLYWEQTSASLDLLADADRTEGSDGLARCTVKLFAADGSAWTAPSFAFFDDEDQPLDSDSAAIRVESAVYNSTDGCYDVVFTGQRVGTVIVRAALNGITADLSIDVTASLNLQVTPTNLTVYEGQTDSLTLRVTDARGALLAEASAASLLWRAQVDSGDSEQAVVECSADEIVYDAQAGTFTLPVSGFAAGEATIEITCRYPYKLESGEDAFTEQSVSLMATTLPADVIGLANTGEDGDYYQQIKIPYTPNGVNALSGQEAETGPQEQGFWLYATHAYCAIDEFTLESAVITSDAGVFPVGSDGYTTDSGRRYHLMLGDVFRSENGDYDLRSVQIETAAEDPITVQLVLLRGGVRYTLTMAFQPAASTYQLTLLDAFGGFVAVHRISYGEGYTPDAYEAQFGVWDIPDAIYADTTLTAHADSSSGQASESDSAAQWDG